MGLALGAQAAESGDKIAPVWSQAGEPDYLTFTAQEAGSTVTLKCNNTATAIYYSIDGGKNWVDCVSDAKSSGVSITLANVGDKVMFKGTKVAYNNSKHFSMTGKIAASGDVGTMTDQAGGQTVSSIKCSSMFKGCTSLTTAPDLPATTLAMNCYSSMFEGCTSLTTAPALPATNLTESCYNSMFNGCTSLTAAPALPAMNLAKNCYGYMFNGCTSLTTAPELPATTLACACYGNMFYGCTSLTAAPELPATTLADFCYNGMFDGCTSLTTAPELPATNLAGACYGNMFYGCTSLTAAPALPATTLAEPYDDCGCYEGMFDSCTSLTAAPALPATNLTDYCYYGMFQGCTSLVVTETAPGKAWSIPSGAQTATDWNTDMFTDCGGDVTAPEVGVKYYIASAPTATIEVTPVTGASKVTVSNGTEEVASPYVVYQGDAVTVVYTADEGYEFAGGAATWTTNFTASAATITVTIPESERPTKKAVKYLEPVYKTVGDPASGIDHWVTNSVSDYTVVTAETTTWNAGWYVVNADVTIDDTVTTSGDVKLILVDGAKLTVTPPAGDNDAIGSAYDDWDASFTVYGQVNGTGALIATGADNPNNYGGAGISVYAAITINGGTVTTTGGAGDWYGQSGLEASYGTIAINGGNVTANGGNRSSGSTAINSGYVIIAGGTVTANAGTSSDYSGGYGIAGGQGVTIMGGTVKANGGASSSDDIYNAGGIGIFGYSVSISGGTVEAVGGNGVKNGGNGIDASETISISDSGNAGVHVTAVGGTGTTKAGDGIFSGEYGTVTVSEDVTVKAGTTSASDVIAHTSEQNIASELAGKRYATAVAKQVTIIDLGDGLKAQVVEGGCTITGDGTGTGVLSDTTALKDKNITNLVIGTGVTGIGEKAFASWRTLRDVEIGADCVEVGALAFGKCHNVTNIACTATGTITIGNNAFVGCNSLEALSFGAMPTWGKTPFLFYSGIYMKDGIPEVYAMPTVTITGYKQVLKGSNDFQNWYDVDTSTPEGKAKYHFFKIALEAE